MKNVIYKNAQTFLDANSLEIIRELPDRFTLNDFSEKVHLVFPNDYAKAIRDFGGEKYLKFWINTYYLPRRPHMVMRQRPTPYDGVLIDFRSKSHLDRVWLKAKKKSMFFLKNTVTFSDSSTYRIEHSNEVKSIKS